MQPTLAFLHAHGPAILALAIVVIPALITGLSSYPQARGVVTWLRVVLDVLSVVSHADSPGTFKLPIVQRSQAPGEKDSKQLADSAKDLASGARALLPIALASAALLAGCASRSPKVVAATATIATVQGLDDGIDVFTQQDEIAEHRIAGEVIAACRQFPSRADYLKCAVAEEVKRRGPWDAARKAIATYQGLLAAGSGAADGDIGKAAAGVISALAAVGINVGGAK